jgi:hypothetical protein
MGLLAGLAWRHRMRRRRRAWAQQREFGWEDALGDFRGVTGSRYTRFSEIDRWRPVPFDMPPPPDRGAVHQRVSKLIEGLAGAIDEGSGRALDPHIESWVAGWIAGVETEYADHCGLIQMLRGQAEQWARETAVEVAQAQAKLGRLMRDYEALGTKLRDSGVDSPDALSEEGDGTEPDSDAGPQPVPEDPAGPAEESEPTIEIKLDF